MKIYPVILFTVAGAMALSPLSATSAQDVPVITKQDAYGVTRRGPHERTWQRKVEVRMPDGQTRTNTASFTEIGSGLCYWDGNAYQDSVEEVRIVKGFGVADKGQHAVIFSPDINVQGAVDMQTSSGRFQSQILGLGFTDINGRSVLFAELKSSVGQVLGNVVTYPDAFDGAKADVRYTFKRSGLSQDIIILEQVPSPESFGLNASAKLEVWTEFFGAPLPVKSVEQPQDAPQGLDLSNENLDFGSVAIGRGKAFSIGGDPSDAFQVSKNWITINQRTFLVEAVSFTKAQSFLNALPQPQAALKPQPKEFQIASVRAGRQAIPERHPAKSKIKEIQTAKLNLPTKGAFVMDYDSVNVNTNGQVFASSATYYVSGACDLTGSTVLEGGTVIKFAKTNSPSLHIKGRIDCQTESWRPAILTATDDSSVGTPIGTNAVSGYYADVALFLDNNFASTNQNLSNIRISYANLGMQVFGQSGNVFSHMQFQYCDKAVLHYYADASYRNILFYKDNVAFKGSGDTTTTGRLEHVTFDQVGYLTPTNFASAWETRLCITNSLLVAVTNIGSFVGDFNATNSYSTNVFQVVGAGAHYLQDASPYKDVGTTNITPSLAADLRKRTTFPPLYVTNAIRTNTTWEPVVARDSDELYDLGWHYEPIDYLTPLIIISNATLTVTNGAEVAGWYQVNFWIQNYGRLVSEGAGPLSPNRLFRANIAQEIPTNYANLAPNGGRILTLSHSGSGSNELWSRFTTFSMLSGEGGTMDCFATPEVIVRLRDCESYNGGNNLILDSNSVVCLTNNLFHRTAENVIGYNNPKEVYSFNNLYYVGVASFEKYDTNCPFVIRNNSFDNCYLSDFGDYVTSATYNGYVKGDFAFWPSTNSTDVFLTNFTYQTSYLSRFYQTTNSPYLSKGSTYATNLGLAWYTCFTNQVAETNTTVEIGYHLVAIDGATGLPLDSDGDGLWNIQEDRNGNAVKDTGETDWNNPDSDGDGVSDYIELLQGRSPFVGATNDVNGVIKLQVYTPLK